MIVDEIYMNIGQSIMNAIEEVNWTTAQLNIEIVGTGVVGYTGNYKIGTEKHDISIRKILGKSETGSGSCIR
ncbi:hypothetical protein LWM68_08070 [Niabella sp. W65]|nr:hypothetical protein [Niabella sp. W65]MCH7362723.1 hypothetical protein [Niabella sp. W65]ULT38678.1 hypothetical protein KRR40_26745 [Niabella sp. I65]